MSNPIYRVGDIVRIKNLCGGIWENEIGKITKTEDSGAYVKFIDSTQWFAFYEIEISQNRIFNGF